MCDEKKVMMLVQLAKNTEQSDPVNASKNYLEAAQGLLELAKSNKSKEDQFLRVAKKLHTKAKKLQKREILTIKDPAKKRIKKGQVNFDSIGGLEVLKEEIRLKIIEPLKDPALFEYYGKSIGGGILMYGPPGCGKSLIAQATANEAKAGFIHVKSSDLKSKYVGETEKNIAELFEKAREQQPTIIFFDEFEVLGGDRSNAQSHEKSAVAQLLTEMDGMDAKNQQILLLAATNEPWEIDPALRREGRFGQSLFIPPPDQKAREKILELHLSKRPCESLNYQNLAKETQGFSGADLKAVCEIATDIPLKESLKTKQRRKISMQDLNQGIQKTNSVMRQWFAKAANQVRGKRLEEAFPQLISKSNEYEMVAA